MTNYTFEEKQIAIKILKDLMAHEVECTRNLYYPFNFHLHAVPSNLIREKIKQLKTVTFGDIKNQVGVRFRVECNNPILQVITLQNNERLALNTENCVVVPIGDYDRVEVINETETA